MAKEIDLRKFEREIESWGIRIKDDDDRKTYDQVFDKKTLLTIYKLFSDGVFDVFDFPIATGKEGNVFRGVTSSGHFVAIKIYRISNATFKDLSKYILGDPRFKGESKRFPNVIYSWARKEYKNLYRFIEAGVRVPNPIALNKNVLVMEYIGDEVSPARSLREVVPEDPDGLARYLLDSVHRAYCKGGIVHGDLSEYNVLMSSKGPVIIDLAQAVLREHWMAEELLVRDISNIARFFKKFGVRIDIKDELEKVREGGRSDASSDS
ncbi:MAG: serine protein kinase RIO [Thermoplasmata archaeon]|nr:serine protein kinase RIO [Thermoplasmata archaeon]